MAIENTSNTMIYGGNGSTADGYPILFRFDAPAWLLVQRVSAGGVESLLDEAAYTLHGEGRLGMARLHTEEPVPPTEQLVIRRRTPAFQTLSLIPNAPLPAKDLEEALDRVVMAVQDRDGSPGTAFSKSLAFPAMEPEGHRTTLPLPHLRKDCVFYGDADTGELMMLSLRDLAVKISLVVGEVGLRGPTGFRGPTGEPGRDGEDGEEGPPGPQGLRGEPGERGPMGDTGDRGEDGLDGTDGAPGDKGERGDKGEPGDPGVCVCSCGYGY